MIPHLAEELWKKIGYSDTLVCQQKWPVSNLSYVNSTDVNLVIQINGKKKLVLNIEKNLNIEETKSLLMNKKNIKAMIGKNKIKKIIVVPNKICNIVI